MQTKTSTLSLTGLLGLHTRHCLSFLAFLKRCKVLFPWRYDTFMTEYIYVCVGHFYYYFKFFTPQHFLSFPIFLKLWQKMSSSFSCATQQKKDKHNLFVKEAWVITIVCIIWHNFETFTFTRTKHKQAKREKKRKNK